MIEAIPSHSIGSAVLVDTLGAFRFRERLTRTRLVDFLLGCVAILVIVLF